MSAGDGTPDLTAREPTVTVVPLPGPGRGTDVDLDPLDTLFAVWEERLGSGAETAGLRLTPAV